MEDLKEMFVQMMKFQMESQQKKKWGKTLWTSKRKRRKNLKKRGKTTTVLPWIAKTTRSTF